MVSQALFGDLGPITEYQLVTNTVENEEQSNRLDPEQK